MHPSSRQGAQTGRTTLSASARHPRLRRRRRRRCTPCHCPGRQCCCRTTAPWGRCSARAAQSGCCSPAAQTRRAPAWGCAGPRLSSLGAACCRGRARPRAGAAAPAPRRTQYAVVDHRGAPPGLGCLIWRQDCAVWAHQHVKDCPGYRRRAARRRHCFRKQVLDAQASHLPQSPCCQDRATDFLPVGRYQGRQVGPNKHC